MIRVLTGWKLIKSRDFNAFNYCINEAADYVMGYPAEDEGITLLGLLAGGHGGLRTLRQRHGAKRVYTALGAASAGIPITEIMTYFAAGFSERFQQYVGREKINGLLSKAAVDKWVRNLQLDAGAIERRVSYGCPALILPLIWRW